MLDFTKEAEAQRVATGTGHCVLNVECKYRSTDSEPIIVVVLALLCHSPLHHFPPRQILSLGSDSLLE